VRVGTSRRENAVVDDNPVALVHGPGWPVAAPDAVARLLAALDGHATAAVAILLAPQTDTLKSVDAARLVTGTVDREGFRAVLSPVAVRPALLPAGARTPAAPGGPLPDAAAVLASARAASCTIAEVEA